MNEEEKQLLIESWKTDIEKNIVNKKIQIAIINYITLLVKNEAVIIISFEHISKLMGIETFILASLVNRTTHYYRTFEIPKRNGSIRTISAPNPILLYAQRWINVNILAKITLHESAKGFIKNKSIKDNAHEHINSECILKLDVENFFPSININRVMAVFMNLGYTKRIAFYLSSICCYENKLPQGGATSPYLSNIIAKRLDYRLSGLARKFGLIYTRYADDITFSGLQKDVTLRLANIVEKILFQEGFRLNKSKTKLLYKNSRKIVTGISISSGFKTIPREKKRQLRNQIYQIETIGLFKYQQKINNFDPIMLERLIGYLHFWKFIEPESVYVNSKLDYLIGLSITLEK